MGENKELREKTEELTRASLLANSAREFTRGKVSVDALERLCSSGVQCLPGYGEGSR